MQDEKKLDPQIDENTFKPKALPLTVLLQPEEQVIEIPRKDAKTVQRLLDYLKIKKCTALVVRDNTLLTPDLKLFAGDNLLVRKVQSTG